MSGWNYRVIHRRSPIPEHMRAAVGHDYDDSYAVHEVYYDEDGKPDMCSENPAPLLADSLKELTETRLLMAMALRKPVLEWDDFGPKEDAGEEEAA